MPPREAALQGFYEALSYDDPVQLYENAPCGYLSTTPEGTIVKVNETFLRWTGHRREDLLGRRRLVDLLTGGGRIYHETHYAPMLRLQGGVRELAMEIVRSDGQRLPVLVNATLRRNEAGGPVVVHVALFAAPERREYERALLGAKRRAEESEAQARSLARTLQRTLMPHLPPVVEGLGTAAAYRPSGEGVDVGGDFYDIFEVGEGRWVAVLGDVCGKGAEAAVVTALVRYSLRAAAVRQSSPARMLEEVNRVLLHDHETDRHCTVLVLRLDRAEDGWRVVVGAGGHPLPLLVRGGGREAEPVGLPGSLVGALERVRFRDHELFLGPGEALLLFTDGVTEARRGREMYDEARLARLLGSVPSWPVRDLVDAVVTDVVDFVGGRPQDDVAVVALGVPPRLGQEARPPR